MSWHVEASTFQRGEKHQEFTQRDTFKKNVFAGPRGRHLFGSAVETGTPAHQAPPLAVAHAATGQSRGHGDRGATHLPATPLLHCFPVSHVLLLSGARNGREQGQKQERPKAALEPSSVPRSRRWPRRPSVSELWLLPPAGSRIPSPSVINSQFNCSVATLLGHRDVNCLTATLRQCPMCSCL